MSARNQVPASSLLALCLSAGPIASLLFPAAAVAQSTEARDLAKQLSNPIASLISVPLQYNYDEGLGALDEGSRSTLNIQPVIPFELNDEWNLISRTVVPYISQDDVTGPGESQSGFGDVIQSFFFSPKAPTSSGWIWGAGPVISIPLGSDNFSSDQWGLGVTGVALKQENGWTYGALANHIWGINPDDGDEAISATFLQPFLSYTTPDAWTFALNTESTYDWNSEEWSVPVNVTASKLVKIGTQPISIGGGLRYWADSPEGGPEGLAYRLSLTFLFPA
jgi:hypothetical protein